MHTFTIGKLRRTSTYVLLFLLVVSSALFASSRGEIHGVAVSPDGKTMAVAYMRGKTGFIYMISMETGIARRLTDSRTGKESSPTFSADGKLFAYSYVSNQTSQQIIVMNVDGSNPHSLAASDTANLYPTFSPDDKTVYFARSQPYPADHLWDIFSVGVDDGDVKQLTHEGFVQISHPSISSDGKKLLVATLGLYTPQRMEIYPLDHPEEPSKVLSPTVSREATPTPIFAYPNFTPDGGSILFLAASNRLVNYDYDVYRLDLASGAIERLTKGIGYASDLKIFADGKTAVLLKWRSDWQGTANKGDFYLLDLQTRKLTRLNVRGLNYPTCGGENINPYFRSKEMHKLHGKDGAVKWQQDGWSVAIIVDRGRAFDFLAWYRPLTVAQSTVEKPILESLRRELLWKLDSPGTCTQTHLKRMEFEKIGRFLIDAAKLQRTFPDMKSGTYFAVNDISIANRLHVGPALPARSLGAPGAIPNRRSGQSYRTILGIAQILGG